MSKRRTRHKARRYAHPVVWVCEDRLSGRWRYAPPLYYQPRRSAMRDLGEAVALVIVGGVVFYAVLSAVR